MEKKKKSNVYLVVLCELALGSHEGGESIQTLGNIAANEMQRKFLFGAVRYVPRDDQLRLRVRLAPHLHRAFSTVQIILII